MAAQLCHAHITYIDVVEILHPGLPCCEEFTREAATEYLRAAIGNHAHERVAFGKKKDDSDRHRSVGEKAGVALARGHIGRPGRRKRRRSRRC
jgi:hypothetical protein